MQLALGYFLHYADHGQKGVFQGKRDQHCYDEGYDDCYETHLQKNAGPVPYVVLHTFHGHGKAQNAAPFQGNGSVDIAGVKGAAVAHAVAEAGLYGLLDFRPVQVVVEIFRIWGTGAVVGNPAARVSDGETQGNRTLFSIGVLQGVQHGHGIVAVQGVEPCCKRGLAQHSVAYVELLAIANGADAKKDRNSNGQKGSGQDADKNFQGKGLEHSLLRYCGLTVRASFTARNLRKRRKGVFRR